MDNPVASDSGEGSKVIDGLAGGDNSAAVTAGGDTTTVSLDIVCALEGAKDDVVHSAAKYVGYKESVNARYQDDGTTIRPGLRILLDKNVGLLCDLVQLIEDAQRVGVDQNTIEELRDDVRTNSSACHVLLKQISTPII